MSYTDPNQEYFTFNDPAVSAYEGYNGGLGDDRSEGNGYGNAPPDPTGGYAPPGVAAELTSGSDDGTGTRHPNPGIDSTAQNMLDSASATGRAAGGYNPGDIVATAGNDPVQQQMIESALAVRPGSLHPGDVAATSGVTLNTSGNGPTIPANNGFSTPSLPNPGITPSTPSTGASSDASGTSPHQLAEADWEKKFRDVNGYFDPTFNSRDAFLHEAQMGDTAIRGATGGGDQLAKMAQFDSDAAKIYGGIKGVGEQNFYGSQQGADWAGLHNKQVSSEYQAALGQGGGQQGASGQNLNRGLGIVDNVKQAVATGNRGQLDWLKSQLVDVPANPIRNQDAFPVAAEIVKDLQTLGVDAKSIHMDDSGTIHFVSASGMPNNFPGNAPLADWVNDLAALKQAIANQNQPPAAPPGNGGGGFPPRSSAPPRSGGYTPPRGNGGGGGGVAAPPAPYAYQGDVAPYDQNTGQFNSVVNGRQIPAAPEPVDPRTGAIQPFNQQRNF